jgi:membrane protease YdiL (CAAX protease family)
MLTNPKQTLTEAAGTEGNGLYRLSIARPFLVPLVLLALALALRIIDVGLLRLDEKWGEAILHKDLGFGLVLLYLWLAGRPVREIGLHGRQVVKAMLISASGISLLMAAAYGLQWIILRLGGEQAAITLSAIDPKEGKSGGLAFALWLVLGNLVNSFMEEGLFRGVMMRHFARRMSPWKANWLQALIFAAWHLVGPAKHFLLGKTDLAGAVVEGRLSF